MHRRGLATSVWANSPHEHVQYESRTGDWTCSVCKFTNFQWRQQCLRCSAARVFDLRVNAREVIQEPDIPHTTSIPHGIAGQNSFHDHKEPATKQAAKRLLSNPSQNARLGLSTSRWAPRTNNNRSNPANMEEVWTKVVSALPTDVDLPPPNPPDLGLPYEVQHYILVTIQRVLEEGCFVLAARWIPDVLHRNNWTCAEAVELSTWKQILPTAVPENAIKPVPKLTLEDALGRAVRIRNSAVHRHLCDNSEIRRMALQAQDLMLMFADSSRVTKFQLLQEALYEWDNTHRHDPDKSRADLEQALREITERPLDNMDWTPNAISLQDVTSRTALDGLYLDTQEHLDEMDID